MRTKTCSKCAETKPLTEFHKAGQKPGRKEVNYRAACKECSRVQNRDYYYKGPSRAQGPLLESLPLDIRVVSYRSVIDRMVGFGICSESTAQEFRARVEELERAGN